MWYQCEYCNRKFPLRKHWQRHRKTHSKEHHQGLPLLREPSRENFSQCPANPVIAEIMPMPHGSNSDVTNKSEVNPENKSLECDISYQANSTESDINVHIQFHQAVKAFKCKKCPESFSKRNLLVSHSETHIRYYKCEICCMIFDYKSELMRHRLTHHGKKSFKCEECQKSFAQKSHLNCHYRTHTGDKPYKCEKCPKAFYHKYSLTRHIITHTGVMPYMCDVCGMTFPRKWVLKYHEQTHTGHKS